MPLSVAALASIAFAPRAAEACSPMCRPLVRLPAGEALPANAVAFELARADATGVQLLDPDGNVLATTVTNGVLRPAAALAPSSRRYALRFPDVCASPEGDAGAHPAPTIDYAFYVRPTAAVPTQTGTLRVVERALSNVDTAEPTILTRVELSPPSDFLPFDDAAELRVTIDGQPLSDVDSATFGRRGLVTIAAHCTGGPWERESCGAYDDAPAGTHTIAIAAHIPGAPNDPAPATLDVGVSCDPQSVVGGAATILDGGVTPVHPRRWGRRVAAHRRAASGGRGRTRRMQRRRRTRARLDRARVDPRPRGRRPSPRAAPDRVTRDGRRRRVTRATPPASSATRRRSATS